MRVVVLLLALFPAAGLAQDYAAKAFAESRIERALNLLRFERLRRSDVRESLSLWQPSVGFGAQLDLDKNWGLRLDLGRERPKFPGLTGRENIDTVTLYLSFASL